MENFTPISASIGGALIGLSAIVLMSGLGRIAGISGVLGGIFKHSKMADKYWRLAFIVGLVVMPIILIAIKPDLNVVEFKTRGWTLLLGGVIVGVGTQLGNGCTSGHGVCGNARLSERSIIATLVFMATGIATVFLSKYLGLY